MNHIMGSRAIRRAYLYLRRADGKRVVLWVSVFFLVVLSTVLVGSLLIIDIAGQGKIFPGITIEGHPVGGLTPRQAYDLIRKEAGEPLRRPLVLYHGDEEATLDPESIDLSVNAKMMACEAYWYGASRNIFERILRRFLDRPLRKDIPLKLSYDTGKLREFVGEVAADLDRDPVDAGISISEGRPRIKPSRQGLRVEKEKTLKAIGGALYRKKRRVPLSARAVKPDLTEEDINKIIVIRESQHTLYLYDMEYLENSFEVALGSPEYPTPKGKFYITHKEKNPAWKNTGAEWSSSMPDYIPPGPGNPLGGYWMDLGGGVGIHATGDEASLGYSVSHGCIRMSEWAAAQLFEAVNVGTPVFIIP